MQESLRERQEREEVVWREVRKEVEEGGEEDGEGGADRAGLGARAGECLNCLSCSAPLLAARGRRIGKGERARAASSGTGY